MDKIKKKTYKAEARDESFYNERTNRNLGWIGNSEKEQYEWQEKLKNVVIGVAGCGGIGGAMAERLVRMGVKNLKLADPETFDVSNINRQFGAKVGTVGKNKAEVVAEEIYSISKDVNIDVYPQGIKEKTADEFVEGCDYVLDKIEIYAIKDRYTLHQAFRRSTRCKFMMLTPVFGHRSFIFKWTRDSMSVEEYFGIPGDDNMDEKTVRQLIRRFIPELPDYPSKTMLDKWFIENRRCPIFAGTPPLAQGLLASRIGQAITGLDQLPGTQQLPVTPGYAMFDTQKWEAKIVEGKWW